MRPDRAMWTAGLALAAVVLAGLGLNLFTGLTRLSWAVALAVAVVACACVWARARSRARAGQAARGCGAGPLPAAPVRRTGWAVSPVTGGFLLLAAVLAGGAVTLADASASWPRTAGFAQLWLLPGNGTAATLGVRDDYPGRQSFRLVLRRDGKTVSRWQLTLADGERWQRTVTAPSGGTLAGGTLAATLTTPGQPLEVTA